MPTWGEELKELAALKAAHKPGADQSAHDILRRRYLAELSAYTHRATIVYATCWLETRHVDDVDSISLTLGDKQGFMEAVSNIKERQLDLVLTSPGGSPEAAEAIMCYLRTRFDHIRAVIPVAAMSAATMMALACDQIVMGTHSQLGPIDPQFFISMPEGVRTSPAQAIIDQFELAKQECQDPKNIAAWLPLLRSLAPGLLAQCRHSRELAEQFVADQLTKHMFAKEPDAAEKAAKVAKGFADFSAFKSHGRPVLLPDCHARGLDVVELEKDQKLQNLVLSVHHSVRHTFNDTPAVKIIENHHGRAYIQMMGQVVTLQQRPQPNNPAAPPLAPQKRKRRH